MYSEMSAGRPAKNIALNLSTSTPWLMAEVATMLRKLSPSGGNGWPGTTLPSARCITSLLPHGRVLVEDVARSLGMSERTLARKLSDEGLNFTEILQQLRRGLAVRYLDDR